MFPPPPREALSGAVLLAWGSNAIVAAAALQWPRPMLLVFSRPKPHILPLASNKIADRVARPAALSTTAEVTSSNL